VRRRRARHYHGYRGASSNRGTISAILAGIVILGIVLAGIEMVFFSTETLFEARVSDKQVKVTVDEDGFSTTSYHILTVQKKTGNGYWVQVSKSDYETYRVRQSMICAWIHGKYTGIHYSTVVVGPIPTIDLKKPVRTDKPELEQFERL